jgi:adenosylcobyric acid synthase
VAGLADADLIVIPGTKSTIADLRFLWSSGMAAEIIRKAQAGTPVIGICGGYQMLGAKILDPQGLDSSAGSIKGLGLIDMETVFGPEKETRQSAGEVVADTPLIPAGSILQGYEIHMGRTQLGPGVASLLQTASGADGAASADGLVIGSYLHGFFDSDDVLAGLLSFYGCPLELPLLDRSLAREHEYDRLARELRASLDIAKIYEIAGLA